MSSPEARTASPITNFVKHHYRHFNSAVVIDAAEAYKVTKEIKDHNIPVILGPSLALPLAEDSDYDQAYRTPAALQ